MAFNKPRVPGYPGEQELRWGELKQDGASPEVLDQDPRAEGLQVLSCAGAGRDCCLWERTARQKSWACCCSTGSMPGQRAGRTLRGTQGALRAPRCLCCPCRAVSSMLTPTPNPSGQLRARNPDGRTRRGVQESHPASQVDHRSSHAHTTPCACHLLPLQLASFTLLL